VFHKTTVRGIIVCGENSAPLRSVSNAVAMGTTASAMTNKALIEEINSKGAENTACVEGPSEKGQGLIRIKP
jgi:hypothetical protein